MALLVTVLAFFFCHVPSTTVIYTLSLHDALPISGSHEDVRARAEIAFLVDDGLDRRRAERAAIAAHVDLVTKVVGLLRDRKSTRLNSSHLGISYAVFCFKKKKKISYQVKLNSIKE